MENFMKILSSACQMTGYMTWFLYSTSMKVWIIMCFVPRRRCSLSGGSGKQLFAFAISSKPHETPMQHLKEVLCFICLVKQHSVMFPSAHLSLYLLRSENPAAFNRTSVSRWWMAPSGRKWQQFNVKMLVRISLHINLDLGDSMCSVSQQHSDDSFVNHANGNRYCR